MASQSDFDFKSYNSLVNPVGSGLKLALATNMLKDVLVTMIRFNSPLRKDMQDILDELESLRAENKKLAAARETQGPATTVPENPNPAQASTTL